MRTLTALILLATLAACSGCENDPGPERPFGVEVVGVEFLKTTPSLPGLYEEYVVTVRIHGADGYPGAGQEVTMALQPEWTGSEASFPEGHVVEYFDIGARGWEWHKDTHQDMLGTRHDMVLYPAEVDGVDFDDNGFAMLPENMDGSVQWAPTGWYEAGNNKQYLEQHVMQGRFTRTGKPLLWSIVSSEDGLEIVIGGKSKLYAAAGNVTVVP